MVKLKPENIHSDQGMLAVLKGKGNKDRMVPISANLISQLREYFKIYRPKVWLFEGEKEGKPYSQRSLQLVFKKAVERSGLPKKHKFHDLRHSYATHMMDAGTNQHVIQKVLGHNSIRTTEIYTHVSKTLLQKIYNPFDNLNM
ncbi:MAG: tyrosine-type recombinase/integrase [Bacteroidetes bacterium]|nr:tyrosine-type recombinase/integrase [Bacteroidota bacterium]